MKKAPFIVQIIPAPWNTEVLVGLDNNGRLWRITPAAVDGETIRGGVTLRKVHYQQYEVGQVNG